MSWQEMAKRLARAVLAYVPDTIGAAELVLVMDAYDQYGGMKMYRINHPIHEKPFYLIVTARGLDEVEAKRLIPPHHPEGASEVDFTVPEANRFTGVNFQGPLGDVVGKKLPTLPPEDAKLGKSPQDPASSWANPPTPGEWESWGPGGRPPSPDRED